MKLFKCHVVLPAPSKDPRHLVRSYVTVARSWHEARARVRRAEPGAEFVSVPFEAPDPLMTHVSEITSGELEALRLACEWNEDQRPAS